MSSKILFKSSVRIKVFSDFYRKALDMIRMYGWISRLKKDWTVTSANDSTHRSGSKHYKSEAIDLRTKDKKHYEITDFIEVVKTTGEYEKYVRIRVEIHRDKSKHFWVDEIEDPGELSAKIREACENRRYNQHLHLEAREVSR